MSLVSYQVLLKLDPLGDNGTEKRDEEDKTRGQQDMIHVSLGSESLNTSKYMYVPFLFSSYVMEDL